MIRQDDIFEVFIAELDDVGERLDNFLADRDELALSRSQLRKAIERGEVSVNGRPAAKAGVKLREGDRVECSIQLPGLPSLTPEAIPLEILHEDDDVLVLVKAAGMVVHPAAGHPGGTLVNALLHHCQALSHAKDGPDGHLRPGIVHRLDKDTSGVMVVARSDRAMRSLSAQFAAHTIERRYLALAWARGLSDSGTFDTRHGRHPRHRRRFTGQQGTRRAVTHYQVLERFDAPAALVACRLETGRTHQIRMHMAEGHAPILGDPLYGDARAQTRWMTRQALHAEVLGFDHPAGHRLRFEAAPPADFQATLDALRSGKTL